MFIWNKRIEIEIYLTKKELDKMVSNNIIEVHSDFGYLGTQELLNELKKDKLVPKYIKSYSMKVISHPSYFDNENTYKLHIYYTQKLS